MSEKARLFDCLSLGPGLRPLTPEDVDVSEMRVALQRAPGVRLNISSLDRQSLGRQEIDDVVSGRGPGVVAVFGFERTNELFEWCRVRSAGGPRWCWMGT